MSKFEPKDCIFYHIYPLGFCGAPQENPMVETVNRIEKVAKWIPRMKTLGVNALYIGPVFHSKYHGYETWDYRKIDSRLGTNEDFKKVCEELRKNGIRIVLDGVFNHVGRGFFAVEDVLRNRENSQYRDWISGLNFYGNNRYNDHLSYDCWAGHEELVKLNLKNPDVTKYLLDSVDMWIEEFGIEGLRLDAADCIDLEFFKKLRSFTESKNPDFWLMGELTHGNYEPWLKDGMLHSVTNYECYKGIHSSITSKNLFEIMSSLDRQFGPWGIYKNSTLYSFVDNHDVNRISSVLKNHRENLRTAYTLIYTMPGIPSIYYMSEYGIEGEKAHHSDAPLRPAVDVDNPEIKDDTLLPHLVELKNLRESSPALRYGNFERVFTMNEYMVFARSCDEDTRLVFINISHNEETARFNFRGRYYEEKIAPCSYKVLKV